MASSRSSSFVSCASSHDPYELVISSLLSSSSRIQIAPATEHDFSEIPAVVVELQSSSSSTDNHQYDKTAAAEESKVVGEEEGVALTWEDLWVTVSNGKKAKSILQGLTGYARPGQLLAIMGPSGSGKSTLLDALAGRLESNTRQSGEILINGRKQALAYGTSAYVTQDEALITTLTVKEAVYYSAQLQLPNSMSNFEKKERSETIIKEMGLQDAMNTRIGGGWGVKGLSGGQRRRVSICIEIITRPKLLFLDEPTSGLDSAASYYVISRIARHREGKTIVASIHQPSAEVFSLFDNVCLLSSGRTVYFGPVSTANQFFSCCGLPCPPLQNPSDHFLKTINKDFDEDIEYGRKTTEEVIDSLVKSYNSSTCCRQVQYKLSELCKREGELLQKGSKKGASFLTQCQVLTKRSFVNMYRDMGYYWMRLAVYIVLTLGLGTMYFNVGSGSNSIQARGSMLMFVASFLTFMATCGFPSFVEEMKVFQRERLNGHYGSGAFAISNTLSATPYLLLVSLIPGAIAYFMAGLQDGIGAGNATENFIYFASMLFVCMLLVEGQMMIVASLVPNFLTGLIIGSGIQGMMILGGGFFRLPNDMPAPFWKYPLYHIAFHKYAYQGLFKNDLEGRIFRSEGGALTEISGESILRKTWQVELEYSKWVNIGILLGMMVVYRLVFFVIVKSGEKIRPALRSAFLPLKSNQPTQIMVVDN